MSCVGKHDLLKTKILIFSFLVFAVDVACLLLLNNLRILCPVVFAARCSKSQVRLQSSMDGQSVLISQQEDT